MTYFCTDLNTTYSYIYLDITFYIFSISFFEIEVLYVFQNCYLTTGLQRKTTYQLLLFYIWWWEGKKKFLTIYKKKLPKKP